MRKVLLGIMLTLFVLLAYDYCTDRDDETVFKEHSALIQEQIKNVGKLVVTEGHFSEVIDYEKSKSMFGDYYSADKKSYCCCQC